MTSNNKYRDLDERRLDWNRNVYDMDTRKKYNQEQGDLNKTIIYGNKFGKKNLGDKNSQFVNRTILLTEQQRAPQLKLFRENMTKDMEYNNSYFY